MLLLRLLLYVSCPGIPRPLQHSFAALVCYVYLSKVIVMEEGTGRQASDASCNLVLHVGMPR